MEPDLGITKVPKKIHASKSDGDLNLYDTNDVMSDGEKSCLSITDENGLSFVNSDKDDAFGFPN